MLRSLFELGDIYSKLRCYLVFLLLSAIQPLFAQIDYQYPSHKNTYFGSYGRVGVDWSFENGGSIGRRLNLNNMGSIGGRLEEQDYLELVPNFRIRPKAGDSTIIHVQARLSVYSTSLNLIGNTSTTSLGGLSLAMPELYVQARNILGKPLDIWIGARLYRGPDVHIADHFYYNDHSGQGFGVEYKNSRFSTIFVASTDTTSTVPPYFYLNIKTGTPSAALRQRTVFIGEHDIELNQDNKITILGEYHHMESGEGDDISDTTSVGKTLNFPKDRGFVIGARHRLNLKKLKKGSFNDFSVRYGTGIANGGDGGLSRTWLTFGAPDSTSLSFKGAYSLALVNHALFNFSDKYSLNGYVILTSSKGGAATKGLAKTFFGKEVYNKKVDFTVGTRSMYYFSDYFHLMGEVHYSQRKDGINPIANMFKVSLAPVYVPTGARDVWARPHFRFVASLARYNDYAMETLYSPYLEFTGSRRWGYYFGIKAEWWIWGN